MATPAYARPNRPYALIQDFDEAHSYQSLDDACGRFFAPKTPLALPLTPRFWEGYREPWQDFFEAASLFCALVSHYANRRPKATSSGERLADQRLDDKNLTRLNALSGAMNLTVETLIPGGMAYRWTSPSLLASFAQMLKQDIVGRKLVQCPCGALFVSPSPAAAYCTERCSLRFQKARQRAARKDEKRK